MKIIIILDGKFITKDVERIGSRPNGTYFIKFYNSYKYYSYESYRIKILRKFNKINIDDKNIYIDGKLTKNIKEIYENRELNKIYYKVIFESSYEDYNEENLKFIRKINSIIEYMKRVSNVISLNTEDGRKLLREQMEKVSVDNLNTGLANYFKMNNNLENKNNKECLIFPFGCNSSQYKAVLNAINNKLSVIEGPPGTGKTQTILNIIANIIVRNMNTQVVSNNNAAIENIEEKLKKYNLDFIVALLGKSENKSIFIENQKNEIPSFKEYENIDIRDITDRIIRNNDIVGRIYDSKQTIAKSIQMKDELSLEYKYYKEDINVNNKKIVNLNKVNETKLPKVWSELLNTEKISIWSKIKYVFVYKVGTLKFYKNELNVVIDSIQNELYKSKIKLLERNIKEEKEFVNNNKSFEKEFTESSMDYLKKFLSIKYKNGRKIYSRKDILRDGNNFLRDYPVILSTTYSSRNTFEVSTKLDYIIMDEASQIDVVTGTLALSSAKYAVVIGDEKQLPNVIPNDIAEKTNKIFKEYNIEETYNYATNSFLSSIKKTINNIPKVMLKEHYRCHPKIINFCNKKFYNNELIIMTEDKGEPDVIKIIKTNKGNHSREKTNQRQVDIIKNELIKLNTIDIGVIAPYNNQVNLIKNSINNIDVSTVHKFQGREKDVIIISTVDDNISDFVGNPNILNVAISRAKNKLIFIVTGNEILNNNILDFIEYTKYTNMEIEESKINSVFDLLYKQYEEDRIEYFKKHNRISRFDSENIIYNLLNEILKEYEHLNFIFMQPMNTIIKDKSMLTEEEKKYASHHNTHLDFLIYNTISKKPILAIEVDGYKYHKEGTKQHNRDILKARILRKYGIPLLRLKTNQSKEKERIKNKLNSINKIRLLKSKSGKLNNGIKSIHIQVINNK